MTPRLFVNLKAITENTRKTIDRCHGFGVEVVGVTKGVSGLPPVAKAMVDGGIKTLGDSRLKNIARMREAGMDQPMLLIRSPALSEVEETVRLCEAGLKLHFHVSRASCPCRGMKDCGEFFSFQSEGRVGSTMKRRFLLIDDSSRFLSRRGMC